MLIARCDGKRRELYANESQVSYYFFGILHRKDGPAIFTHSGFEEWRKNGVLHCEVGPAIKYSNGNEVFYLNGKRFHKTEYYAELSRRGIK